MIKISSAGSALLIWTSQTMTVTANTGYYLNHNFNKIPDLVAPMHTGDQGQPYGIWFDRFINGSGSDWGYYINTMSETQVLLYTRPSTWGYFSKFFVKVLSWGGEHRAS